MTKKPAYRVVLLGDNTTYIENNYGKISIEVIQKTSLSDAELLTNLQRASVDLNSHDNHISSIHIDRQEVNQLFEWLTKEFREDESRIALLVGNAGTGKSVIMKDLLEILNKQSIPVLGIKVDKLLNIQSNKEIENELNLGDTPIAVFNTLSNKYPIITVLVDQIDALSQSLSSERHALNAYDRLINQLSTIPNVRIILSCRTYDLNYDPTLRSYKGKKIFNISLLSVEQVKKVVTDLGLSMDESNLRLVEFLRTPLHLKLFCRVGNNKKFDDSITLQKLYDEIWNEYLVRCGEVDSNRVILLLESIAAKMNLQQHIVVDKREFDAYSKELTYLLHSDLLQELTSNKVQFLHQSFFDYVYARTFITSGKHISFWLKTQHQGLFIRSQVKQTLSFLRDYNVREYINELDTVLFQDDYRFHLRLLLIQDLAFYAQPLQEELSFVRRKLLADPFNTRLFLESIQSPQWFEFIIETEQIKSLLESDDNDSRMVLINLCTRIIWQSPELVLSFLDKHNDKIWLVERVITQIPENQVSQSYALYSLTVDSWEANRISKYHYLEKVLTTDPDFVIEELKRFFHLSIDQPKDHWSDRDYIPDGYDAKHVYEELYKRFPDKAITFFVYVIEKVISSEIGNMRWSINGDMAFSFYAPMKGDPHYTHQMLYDVVFEYIGKIGRSAELDVLLLPLLKSDLANIISIGVYYLLQDVKNHIDHIYGLFTRKDFFIDFHASEILRFYAGNLLTLSYPLLSENRQIVINDIILKAIPEHHKKAWEKRGAGVVKYGYARYDLNPYTIISLIPEDARDKYLDLKKKYQEGYRKYGVIKNSPPKGIEVHVGERSLPQRAYQNMTFSQWKKSFKKLNNEQRSIADWDKPTMRGNRQQLVYYVTQEPDKYYHFVSEIISDHEINDSYILAGLEGLKEAHFDSLKFQILVDKVIQERARLDDSDLSSFIRQIEYCIKNTLELSQITWNFLKEIALNYPDRKMLPSESDGDGMRAVQCGINSVKGAAVEAIVQCYRFPKYKEEIFSTLEYIADNANEVTRSCVIFNGAWLNHLDKQRNYNLYLRLVSDFNLDLLTIPCHNGHPLLYHINFNFNGLKDFFKRVITIDKAGKPMVMFLLSAYLKNHPGSYSLLLKLLSSNPEARNEMPWIIATQVLEGKQENSSKGWRILNYLLNFEDEDLGEKIDRCFIHFPKSVDSNLEKFIDRYLASAISKYRSDHFYDLLNKIISQAPEKCLEWFFKSNPQIPISGWHVERQLDVLIQAYNGIRTYNLIDPLLERAMDMFDTMLRISEYRNGRTKGFLKELES